IFFCISDTLVPTTYLVDTTLSYASDYDQTALAGRLLRSWICPECGANHDSDVNAAKNIKAVGLITLAHGATVNPKAA
ncbi:zinc ribbon domain-containing protein, partial [Citrobacter freundii]